MGRTNQVLTGGSIYSTSPQTTTMKIVLALLVLCLFQFSLAEPEVDDAETNLVIEREVRDAGRKRCTEKKSRKSRKGRKGGKKSRKSNVKKSSGQKKGGKK